MDAEEPKVSDKDPRETQEWLESLDYLIGQHGRERAIYIFQRLKERLAENGISVPNPVNTPYVNTIKAEDQPQYPGNMDIERRIRSVVRWNAMAMVVKANRLPGSLGGHISTYASAATLYEVGFNHFFKGHRGETPGDQIYFQGHASPGIYGRAYVEGRIPAEKLHRFRQEVKPGGLSSYPHPWLMPEFWEFPTVSMGLAPIMAIYQARFNRYLENRGIKNTSHSKVWAYLGDGETDEPETLGSITLAAREKLDNLVFVINCNLQRLDGPVRGNGKIIQELEAAFRGAGWNVIKVIWGSDWDPLLAEDKDGLLVKRMGEVVDGWYQKYTVEGGAFAREHFFGAHPKLRKLVEHMSDEQIHRMLRGGHDARKVYAAYKAAAEHKGAPTVILAKTIKGYGLGEAGEGRNISHQQKKLNDNELREFRTRFGIPIGDQEIAETPFYKPPPDSPELKYMLDRRKALGGGVPERVVDVGPMENLPQLSDFQEFLDGSGGREVSTTMGFARMISRMLAMKEFGKHIVPIIPDEARTFGLEALFRQYGIYSSIGQLYEPADKSSLLYYFESKQGQILEEGITEAGSMSSFIAAGTSYATHGVNMVPFFIYYSMFGFQRIGDLIWAAGDMRTRGFLLGATAGRTSLNGEGLQHQDGHSHLLASTVPNVMAYDPAYVYELAVIIEDGLRRMYEKQEPVFYYITLYNVNHDMPAMPKGAEEGIRQGMYKLKDAPATKPASKDAKPLRAQIFGSGPLVQEALRAQNILAEKYGVAADVWSVTSYKTLRYNAMSIARANMLHPDGAPRRSHVEKILENVEGPCIAVSDYMRSVPEMIAPWVPGGLHVLGTDGYGRSDTRESLRDWFEVSAEYIVIATLYELQKRGELKGKQVEQAIADLGVDRDKAFSLFH
jgi:pyruvate dehydrogenase E1 component